MSSRAEQEALRRAAIAMVPTDPWLQHERQRCLADSDNPKARVSLLTDPDDAWAARRPFKPGGYIFQVGKRRSKPPVAA